ncbi:MAG: nitrophenyl compound nitroreductase subunit ArsF family protein [Verrucomicrobiales bacterium]
MKTIAKTLLLVLAFAGIAYYAWDRIAGSRSETASSETTSESASSVEVGDPAAPVVVTYFSSDVRCPTCLEIESLTRRAVEERFAGPLAEGTLAFRILNMDEEENVHFVDDYELAFKTVVIRGDAGGDDFAEPWVKMDEVWSLTAKPDEFIAYLAEEIERRLPKAS